METPLQAAVQGYIDKKRSRFHMPGHKGKAVFPVGEAALYDITEVEGADSLYEASGAIAQTEKLYARLYGSKVALLSAGGATLCIQAMLALACPPGSKIIAARGIHTSAVNAMALLDLHPVWIWPQQDPELGLMSPVTPVQVEQALAEHPDAAAVYLTSPNYFGIISDIKAAAMLCHRRGKPLLVDNAHGAHLRFLEQPAHPIGLGADLCCDSLHKTLPVLTGGAVLHIGNNSFVEDAKRKMSLFGSTSPSYLIMLSMDRAVDYLAGPAARELKAAAEQVSRLEELAEKQGYAIPQVERDPTRLTLGFAAAGYNRREFENNLRFNMIEPEYLGDRFGVFLGGGCEKADFQRLERILAGTVRRSPVQAQSRLWTQHLTQAVPLRTAVLAPQMTVPVEMAAGRVAAGVVAPCPPGIPLLVPGEQISPALALSLKNTGVFHMNVLK